MHIAFQLLPITEIILQSEFVSDSFQTLKDSVRHFADELGNLTRAVIAHDSQGTLLPLSSDPDKHRALVQSHLSILELRSQRFLEHFDGVTLGVFARQLSLCLLQVVSVTTKFAWSNIIPQALEGFLYSTMEKSNSMMNAHSKR